MISGTLLINPTGNLEPGTGGREIVSVLGFLAIPKEMVALYARPNQLQIVRGDPAMLSLFLTGESTPLPEQHHNKSPDYLVCQPIWRAP